MICIVLSFVFLFLPPYVSGELQPWFTAGLLWLSLFNIPECVVPELRHFFMVVKFASSNSPFLLHSAFKHLLLGNAWMLLRKRHYIKDICSKKSDLSQQEMQFSKTSTIGDVHIQLCIMTKNLVSSSRSISEL